MKITIFEFEGPCVPINIELDDGISSSVCFVVDRREEVFNEPAFIDADYKVYVAKESFPYSKSDTWIPFHQNNFDFVLTTQLSLLERMSDRTYYLPFATSWCKSIDDRPTTKEKQFSVSFMPGSKFIPEFEGHYARKQIYYALNNDLLKTSADVQLFHPENWVDNKEDIFDGFQYSIIVENCVASGWFTEKLLDPMMRMTVPIYRGAPDVSPVFNEKGILAFQTGDQLVQVLSDLDAGLYQEMVPYLEENYKIAKGLAARTPKLHSFNRRMVELTRGLITNH